MDRSFDMPIEFTISIVIDDAACRAHHDHTQCEDHPKRWLMVCQFSCIDQCDPSWPQQDQPANRTVLSRQLDPEGELTGKCCKRVVFKHGQRIPGCLSSDRVSVVGWPHRHSTPLPG